MFFYVHVLAIQQSQIEHELTKKLAYFHVMIVLAKLKLTIVLKINSKSDKPFFYPIEKVS